MTLLQILLKDLTPADWFGGAVVIRLMGRKAWVLPMAGGFEIRLSSVLMLTTELKAVSTELVADAVEMLVEAERVELTRRAEIELARIYSEGELQE